MEGCQTVFSQVGNGKKMVTGIWEIQICRLWTDGEEIFPFDQSLHEVMQHLDKW